MLRTSPQVQFAEATAELFNLYSQAGTRLVWASADEGMAVWAQALQLAARRADARFNEWRSALQPWWGFSGTLLQEPSVSPSEASAGARLRSSDPAYASYRTSSGHASAQVVVLGDRG
jgi:hypothetical protein